MKNAMDNVGLGCPDELIASSKIERYSVKGDRARSDAGWYILFDMGDIQSGAFGTWKDQDTRHTWCSKSATEFTPEEKKAYALKMAAAKRLREVEQAKVNEACRVWSREAWDKAPAASDDHPYLVRKGIAVSGARQYKDSLMVPVQTLNGIMQGIQFIQPDGSKKFKTGTAKLGAMHLIGVPKDDTMIIAEGFATAASINMATGHAVLVAFDSGNLKAVAEAARLHRPTWTLIVAGDDDAWARQSAADGSVTFTSTPCIIEGIKRENTGRTKATEAAKAVSCAMVLPKFNDVTNHPTDFNDLHMLDGLDAVRLKIETAEFVTDVQSDTTGKPGYQWPEPLSIETKIYPEPYPLEALPETIRLAVKEVLEFVKAPAPLVVSAALAALSMAIQAQADIVRADKLSGPSSLFLLTIADSGERKSTCDGFFTSAIREYESAQAEAAKPDLKRHIAALAAWDAKYNGIKDVIRLLAKSGKSTTEKETELQQLQEKKPESPRVPRIIYGDATPEALKYSLSKQWPSGAVVSSEAGVVFGSHGMGKDSAMRNLATLNQLWDGTEMPTERRSSESFTVKGARLTMALQVQEATLRAFFKQSGELARGTGFLARFLIAWPESTQGFRPFTEAPANWPHLAAFNRRISEILNQDIPIDEDGALHPVMTPMTPAAKQAWVSFHDAIEGELVSGGELYDIRDVASKTADNAARLACLFQGFNHGGGAVGLEAFESASMITAWHLNEARRFFGGLALPQELTDAARLDSWMVEHCRKEKTGIVPIAKLQQCGPCGLRSKVTIDAALEELEELNRARRVKDGKRRTIHVNPALLAGDL